MILAILQICRTFSATFIGPYFVFPLLIRQNTHKKAISQSHTGLPSDPMHWISISGTLHKHTTDKFQSMASCHVTPKDYPVLQTKWRRRIVEQCHRQRGSQGFRWAVKGAHGFGFLRVRVRDAEQLGVFVLLFRASSFRPPRVIIFVIVYCSRGSTPMQTVETSKMIKALRSYKWTVLSFNFVDYEFDT